MNNHPSRRSFLTALGALGGLVGVERSTVWARPIFFSRDTDKSQAIKLSISATARDGLNNFLPPPFEITLLGQRADLRRAVFARADTILAAGEFRPENFSKLVFMEFPKREYGARRIGAIMDPMDAVAYLALALLVAPAIERNRIGADEGVIHSCRYRPSALRGRIFDGRFDYRSFLEAARRRAGESSVRVACDIANFFGSVSPSVVGTALADAAVPKATADFIVSLLHFWSGPEFSGLPIGPQASAILAEAVLSRVDKSLRAAGVEFVRYVDDFRLIAPDRETAERHLRVLEAVLAESNLALNPAKTRIIETAGAEDAQLELVRRKKKKKYPHTIPRSFFTPTPKELNFFHTTEAKSDPAELLTGELLPASQVRKAIRVAVCTGQPDFMSAIPAILQRYPEFSRYTTLALIYGAGAGVLPEPTRHAISSHVASAILDDQTPVFAKLDFLRLLGEQGYVQRESLLSYALASEPRGLGFRAALDALHKCGGIPASLFSRYDAADQWARRALAISARNPKRLSVNSDDPFLSLLA